MTSVWRRFPRIASRDYLAGDKPLFLLPVALIAVLTVSYITRSSDRRMSPDEMLSQRPQKRGDRVRALTPQPRPARH